jgi:hypothetical protein
MVVYISVLKPVVDKQEQQSEGGQAHEEDVPAIDPAT